MNTGKNRSRSICLVGIMIALFGAAFTVNERALDLFMKHADQLPPVVAWPLGLLALVLLLVSGFAYPTGTGILCYRLSVVIARPPLSLPIGLGVPISGNIFMALQALPFLAVPAGTRIRPMGWSAMMFFLGVALLVLGIIAAVRTIKKEHRPLAGACGVVLSLTPIIVGVLSLSAVCAIKGLEMAK